MSPTRPYSLVAELSYRCPLHCPYCSNPVDLGAAGRAAGLYSTLVTGGTPLTRERAERLKEAGLDHVQVSVQSPDPQENDRIAGNRSFEKKVAAARAVRALGLPLTIN